MRARLPQQAIPTSRVALRTPSAVIAATRCGSRAFMVRDNGHRPRAMAVPHHEDNHRIPRMGLPATIYNPHDVPKRSEKRSFARCVNLTAACGERSDRVSDPGEGEPQQVRSRWFQASISHHVAPLYQLPRHRAC